MTATADNRCPLDVLADEYIAYCDARNWPKMSADELVLELDDKLTSDERAYLNDFISRWEATRRALDEQEAQAKADAKRNAIDSFLAGL